MPDLITHLTLSHLLIRSHELIRKPAAALPFRILFYSGILLPDILTRPWYILFPGTYRWTVALHTPLGSILFCAAAAMLFESPIRKRAFLYLAAGSAAHFVLDALQKQVIYNNYWFFPVSWKPVGWGIAGAGTYLEWIPLWIGLVIVFESIVRLFNRRKNRLQKSET